MESLNAIGVFVQVAETRSFVAAGRALGISASAVGKSVARFEERLGVRLFHRSTRSIALTAEGNRFLQRCRRVVAELEEAQLELSETTTAPRGRLRISLPIIGKPFLALFAEFQQRYPEIELDLDFTDRLVDIIEEGFDAVIRSGEPKNSALTARSLGTYRMLAVGSPAYFAERGRPEVPEDLLGHACIHFRFPQTGKLQTWVLRRDDRQVDLDLPVSTVCNTLEGRVCFALRGLGIAYVSDFVIRDSLASGDLVTVLDDFAVEAGVFNLLWPSGRHVAPKLRAFIDFLSKHTPLER